MKKRFKILRVGDDDRLIRKRKGLETEFKNIVCFEEVHQAISVAHSAVGHGGEKKTSKEGQKKWANLTIQYYQMFISFCIECQEKKKRRVHKDLVVKPVRSETFFFSRCQIDLINFQTLPDGEFKYILTFINHFSKFCVLRPLTSKRTKEVANTLLPIFFTFGAPVILHTDNGRVFVNAVISELSTLWPELILVTGRQRHPQSQGAVERLNGVIQDKLKIWMYKNKSSRWSVGVHFVQWQINISEHETIKTSPFKVMFGIEPKVGLASTVIPPNMLGNIRTEEYLDTILQNEAEGAADEEEQGEEEQEREEDQDGVEAPQFPEARQLAAAGQEKTALRMTRRAKHLLSALQVGDNATLKVPEFDRGPSDSRNLLVVVLQRDEDLYQVGCREGRITTRYTAADMDLVKEKLLTPDEVPDVEMALRTAVTRYKGGQGYMKCACKTNCTTSRCSCTNKLLKYNSCCPPGRSYSNI
ncbi:KRAB-A domain-containing protein 2-like [Palaemon carinicauda]|uniref:KRAB-A domain-containing protein 2-like n=1 Tax=Palaemon carinicauda TaxID=392227 RepID=UPI0035B619C4